MRYVPPTFTDLKDMAAIDVARLTEDGARTILERIRWPKGPVCPHCRSKKATRIKAKSATVRDGLLQCNECRKQFTVTVGTIMHRSHITLRQWVQAFHSMCSHKKGVSALQLQRNLGLKSYKSAWHLAHRIRFAMREAPLKALLHGTVEVDETYVGGKTRLGRRGRGSERKTPVVALVERGGRGNMHARVVDRLSAKTLRTAIREGVHQSAEIMTDESPVYHGLGFAFASGHQTVTHSKKEYARGAVHINPLSPFSPCSSAGCMVRFITSRNTICIGTAMSSASDGVIGKPPMVNTPSQRSNRSKGSGLCTGTHNMPTHSGFFFPVF